tara:strand:+ start:11517 stop:11624 length:108 start_codon:yes stop_codon:yes gene_type:complete
MLREIVVGIVKIIEESILSVKTTAREQRYDETEGE